ncbi:MAG: tRNA pseudouridine(55) synthase TruB, partial [Phycisphaerales bacterium]
MGKREPDKDSDATPSGLLVLDKPVGIPSTKLLYRVRRLTRVRKSGHAGALDPLASGVLILCLGKATKLTESLMDLAKVYRASARLDVTNPGYDLEMELEAVSVERTPTQDEVLAAALALEGRTMQAPPTYSSVKIGGVSAYKLAQKGRISKLQARPVNVYWIRVRRYSWPELDFEVACGRGTYIRSLIRDLGEALQTGGCLTSLRRVSTGP